MTAYEFMMAQNHVPSKSHYEPPSPHFLYEEKTPEGGVIRLEKWPEGYELWYHGMRVWKSNNEATK